MAVYKVPQDVEAEDKLLGPFTFRQFIYLGIAAGSAAVGFFLARVSLVLLVIPLPFFVFFGVLALPLRKDQPMEIYLLAIVRFYLKPKRRIWNPDGTITHVDITAPHIEAIMQKSMSEETTQERLDYLARVMDSRGWSVKGVTKTNDNLVQAVADEVANTSDIMDKHNDLAKSFDGLIAKKKQENIQKAKAGMKQATQDQPASQAELWAKNPYRDVLEPADSPRFNPYPNAIHQKIIQPVVRQNIVQPSGPPAMKDAISPGTIRLAYSPGLSISAIAHEAQRLKKKNEEVVIELH